MVNLRGAIAGIGRGLAQVGQFRMEQQAQADRDQRLLDREMALARFRGELEDQQAETRSLREDKEYARRTPMVIERETGTLRAREPFAVREAERAEDRQIGREERDERRDIAREGRQNREWDRRESRQAAREIAAETREAQRNGRRVRDRYTNDQGYRVIVYEDGTEWTSSSRVRPTSSQSDDDFLLDDEPAPPGMIDETIGEIARSTSEAARDRPPMEGARRGPDGNWYVQQRGRWFRVEE